MNPASRPARPDRNEQPAPDLEVLSRCNRVDVRTNLAALLNEVDDPPTLYRLHQAVLGITGEWSKPEAGVAVTPVQLEFMRDDDPIASIGVAPTVVTLHQFGDFWSQPSTPEREAELLGLAGVKRRS